MYPDDWRGAYDSGWQGLIVPEAFAHPAKFSRALIARIYDHCRAEGWLAPGDVVLDCFAGVGLGALDAQRLGLTYIGVELEAKFCRFANGCECDGYDPGTWETAQYLEVRPDWLCPSCEGKVLIRPQQSDAHEKELAEVREVTAHHYEGNLELWQRRFGHVPGWGTARLLQGDSRELAKVVAGAGLAVSSPPFAESLQAGRKPGDKLVFGNARYGHKDRHTEAITDYGHAPGQLADLPATAKGLDLALASPPFLATEGGRHPLKGQDLGLMARHSATGRLDERYGSTPGQLGAMPTPLDSHGKACRISAWHTTQVTTDAPADGASIEQQSSVSGVTTGKSRLCPKCGLPRGDNATAKFTPENDTGIGGAATGTGAEPEPRESCEKSENGAETSASDAVGVPGKSKSITSRRPRKRAGSGTTQTRTCSCSAEPVTESGTTTPVTEPATSASQPRQTTYVCKSSGASQRNTGCGCEESGGAYSLSGQPPGLCVSSPPFGDRDMRGARPCLPISTRPAYSVDSYGDSPANLGNLPPGDPAAVISSPPYEASVNSGRDGIDFAKAGRPDKMQKRGQHYPIGAGADCDYRYGESDGQVGVLHAADFWSASRVILEQVYAVLKPGGHAVWVTKRFVRAGKIVEFTEQWSALCQAVGFVPVCQHRAMLTQGIGEQRDVFGNHKKLERAKKSFFRRLAESKGSPRIDWEDVTCWVKPS